MHLKNRRPSPALIISLIALLVALGGTSYAAFKLPKNSVGTKQLKNNAVTRRKIKNGAVTQRKLAGGLTVAEAKSTALASNANGLAGPLASGKTLQGTFSMSGNSRDYPTEDAITFQIPLASPPAVDQYIPPDGKPTAQCPGTVWAPAAAPGQLCFYGAIQVGSFGFGDITGYPTKFGTVIYPAFLFGSGGGGYESDGTWAVTAP